MSSREEENRRWAEYPRRYRVALVVCRWLRDHAVLVIDVVTLVLVAVLLVSLFYLLGLDNKH